jgi:hypothetical protein
MAHGTPSVLGTRSQPQLSAQPLLAQRPVGWGGALAINSDDGATQQLPRSELLSHWACRWPLLALCLIRTTILVCVVGGT